MKIKFIKTREGDLVKFDRTRIERAIEKAALSAGKHNFDFVDSIVDCAINKLSEHIPQSDSVDLIDIEKIQDAVEMCLMES